LVAFAYKFALSHNHKRTLLNKNNVAVLIHRHIPSIWLKHLLFQKLKQIEYSLNWLDYWHSKERDGII